MQLVESKSARPNEFITRVFSIVLIVGVINDALNVAYSRAFRSIPASAG